MNLEINENAIMESFIDISNQILNEYILNVGDSEYSIKNIEFYYYNENNHADENSHSVKYKRAKKRQRLNAQWYLHKITINKKCKHKGLDYTFGDGVNFGGILIKEVIRLKDSETFTQSKFVDELIDKLNPKTKEDFLEMIEDKNKVNFIYRQSKQKNNIFQEVRKGLKKEDKFKYLKYAFKIK